MISSRRRGWITGVAACVGAATYIMSASMPARADVQPWLTLPQPAALPKADESGLAPVDDILMWYAIFNKGGGDPVLMVHGGTSNAETWGNQVPALMRNHEVILGESRGHGRSTRSDKPYSYRLMADDYVGLLDFLKVDKVALVGWSDGAIIGLDIAMRHPERLTKLWAYGANTQASGLKESFFTDPVVAEAKKLQAADYRRLSPTPDGFDSFSAAIEQMWKTQPDYKSSDLARITTPTVIVDGEYDEGIKREHTEEIARAIPAARLLILPNMSHWGHWQNPALYNRELISFLDAPRESRESPLDGAWQVVEVEVTGDGATAHNQPQPSLVIFSRGYYSWSRVTSTSPRALFVAETPTDAERIAAYDSVLFNAGKFAISGSTLTVWPVVAKNPNIMTGGSESYRFQLSGDMLEVHQRSEDVHLRFGDQLVSPSAARELRLVLRRLQ